MEAGIFCPLSNRYGSSVEPQLPIIPEEVLSMEVLKVSAKSNPNSVAGALAGVLRERGAAELQAIGAGAINQAIKAVAIARGFVAPGGVDLICIPAFTDIVIDGEDRTAIKLIVEPR
ncbi:Stage V sporulation protein S [Paenibacillus sp. P22]|nr:Stage V sporulation protein S [Paenibacillus sp. P22]